MFLFSSGSLKKISLSLIFSNYFYQQFKYDVPWCHVLVLGIDSVSWICGFIFFIKYENFTAIIFSSICLPQVYGIITYIIPVDIVTG